jgi:hypothetical protein
MNVEAKLTHVRISHACLSQVHLFHGESASRRTSCRKSSTLPHNRIDYLLYDEEGRTFQLHDTFLDIFGDDDDSVSDIAVFLYSTGLSKTK